MSQEPNRPIVGANPEGVGDPESAARAVQQMFTSIAPRYDLLNHVLSFNIDRLWCHCFFQNLPLRVQSDNIMAGRFQEPLA